MLARHTELQKEGDAYGFSGIVLIIVIKANFLINRPLGQKIKSNPSSLPTSSVTLGKLPNLKGSVSPSVVGGGDVTYPTGCENDPAHGKRAVDVSCQ